MAVLGSQRYGLEQASSIGRSHEIILLYSPLRICLVWKNANFRGQK